MDLPTTLRTASGWLELGLPNEALSELFMLPHEQHSQQPVLKLKLRAQMACAAWNAASDTARLLCTKVPTEPEFFLSAAYCLHETGDTFAARNQLLRGPKALFEMPVFHYNLACYLWTLGQPSSARSHLNQAIAMDASYRKDALADRDLAGIGPLP
jgi:Flp pilus assembly protein TadD